MRGSAAFVVAGDLRHRSGGVFQGGVDEHDLDTGGFAAAIGACMAETSVGAISSASGWEATTASTIGFCSVGVEFSGPWVVTVAPWASASASMPHCMEM